MTISGRMAGVDGRSGPYRVVIANGPPDNETIAGGASTFRRDVGRRRSWHTCLYGGPGRYDPATTAITFGWWSFRLCRPAAWGATLPETSLVRRMRVETWASAVTLAKYERGCCPAGNWPDSGRNGPCRARCRAAHSHNTNGARIWQRSGGRGAAMRRGGRARRRTVSSEGCRRACSGPGRAGTARCPR